MGTFTTRPVILGTRGVVTSGHYLATAAGFHIMDQGGNTTDAAASCRMDSCGCGMNNVSTFPSRLSSYGNRGDPFTHEELAEAQRRLDGEGLDRA